MEYSLSLREAAYLSALLQLPNVKEMYDSMVRSLMEVAEVSEAEAKAMVFPQFLEAVKSLARDKDATTSSEEAA